MAAESLKIKQCKAVNVWFGVNKDRCNNGLWHQNSLDNGMCDDSEVFRNRKALLAILR